MKITAGNTPVSFHFLVAPFYFPERRRLKQFLADMFTREQMKLDSLTYVFCTDDYLLELNKTHLAHDYYTDILTFDLSGSDGVVGEVYISIDRVRANAAELQVRFQDELHRVLFHGVLHLCGYTDASTEEKETMRALEDEYLIRYATA